MVWNLTSEQQLEETYRQSIEPFWQSQVHSGHWLGKHGVRLNYAWSLPKGCERVVVISSGRIESLLKYKELVFDLFSNGLGVFICDHRGQGLSERMTSDHHHGYVANFNDYVDDLISFVHQQVRVRTRLPLHLLCHSMGGAIGVLAALREPDLFRRIVVSAPMFGIRPAMPGWMASGVIGYWLLVNRVRRQSAGYFFGQKPYAPAPFGLNKLTHSAVRYRIFRELYAAKPEIQLGGVTSEWLHAAHRGMAEVESNAHLLAIPALVLSAGSDSVVDNRRQKRVADLFPDGRFHVVEHARHELFIETDSHRNEALTLAMDFIAED
ncbi:alpha/beta fold hydrolase [Alteromonas aestuariivivens]|uniref:Alpha/beta fold hydrolase n=1 Tax=Alteromonas aestuariivivens TaxID=1938339 RepID=A0A3D8M9Z5_9ALTE|nr:alpha/beta fold hydrolase [Alteromonas aestuariivivens]RDV26684.1 alpha/beta fold hydrolase [Alteromonas aestuariivivens]